MALLVQPKKPSLKMNHTSSVTLFKSRLFKKSVKLLHHSVRLSKKFTQFVKRLIPSLPEHFLVAMPKNWLIHDLLIQDLLNITPQPMLPLWNRLIALPLFNINLPSHKRLLYINPLLFLVIMVVN